MKKYLIVFMVVMCGCATIRHPYIRGVTGTIYEVMGISPETKKLLLADVNSNLIRYRANSSMEAWGIEEVAHLARRRCEREGFKDCNKYNFPSYCQCKIKSPCPIYFNQSDLDLWMVYHPPEHICLKCGRVIK